MCIAGAIAGYALRAECSPAPQFVKTLASHMVGQGIGEPAPLSSRHPVARPASPQIYNESVATPDYAFQSADGRPCGFQAQATVRTG